jgi:hypothetical protein
MEKIKKNFGRCVITFKGGEPADEVFVQIENGYVIVYYIDEAERVTSKVFYPFDMIDNIRQVGDILTKKVE